MKLNKRFRQKAKAIYYKYLCKHCNDDNKSSYISRALTNNNNLINRLPGKNKTAVRLIITGKVSGVGFPGWLRRKAQINNLEPFVREKSDKTVEAILVGFQKDQKNIEEIIRYAWKGPSKARVEKVKELWFNKAVTTRQDEKTAKVNDKHLGWSIGTAIKIQETLTQLNPIMAQPNYYPETDRVTGTDELLKEAVARNLFAVKYLNKELFVVSPRKELGFQRSQTTNVSSTVHALIDNKHLTKKYLSEKGFPVPSGAVFSDFEAAKDYLNSSDRPLVAKPVVGVNGSGVTVDIPNEEILADAWEYAKHFNEEVILEELVEGVDIRIVVIGGKACSAYIRVPANVMGDGYQSIEMLMDEKNKQKLNNPRLCKTPIVPDTYTKKFLARQGFDYDSIPAKGQIILFHLKANISKGGDTNNVTDLIHPDLMHLAEEVVQTIGIDDFWGLDLLVERIDLPRTEQKCAIIEINSTANIESVNFPFYGQRYNAAHALIKHVFPESSEDEDYKFESKLVQLTGFLGKAFSDYVSRIARNLKLNGSMRMNEKIAEITLQGRRHHILYFLDGLIDWQGEDNEVVENLQIFNYDGNVKDGFSIEEENIGFSNIFNDNLSIEFDLDSIDKKSHPNQDHPIVKGQDLQDLDVQLFLTEFKLKGFTGRHVYNGLFELRSESAIGFSSMYHSSLFCDNICDRIYPARKLFIKHGLPVPSLVRYKCNKKKAIESYFVRHAKCCYVNIMNPEKTLKYLVRNKKKLSSLNDKARKQGVNYLLLMEQLKGWHVCVAVVGDQTVCSLIITPVTIEGNGNSSISALIEEKNHQRSLNPWFRELPILFDKHLLNNLALKGYRQQDILPEGTKILVETELIYEYGGETFTVDGYLHDDFYKKAVQAVECIPGLEFACVEMIIPRPNLSAAEQRWVLLKVDTKPRVAKFQYPWRGEPCNVAEKVVADLCLTERALWI